MTTLIPGSIVRLRFDQGPASIGVVQEGEQRVRTDDGVRMVPVVWIDRLAYPTDVPELTIVNHVAFATLPETILVPMCEHVETFPDGFGLACSEPGVPTSIDVPCWYDATHVLYVKAAEPRCADDETPDPINLCDGHAARYRTDPNTVVTRETTV